MNRSTLLVPFVALCTGCAHSGSTTLVEPSSIEPGSPGGTLVVVVTGAEPDRGTLRAALFDRAEGFATEEGLLVGRKVEVGQLDTLEVRFEDTVQGRYAISVFQDVDDDGSLDTGAFGIPTEPYGFSRNATGNFGPPSFGAAAFDHGAGDQTIRIHLGGVRLPSEAP